MGMGEQSEHIWENWFARLLANHARTSISRSLTQHALIHCQAVTVQTPTTLLTQANLEEWTEQCPFDSNSRSVHAKEKQTLLWCRFLFVKISMSQQAVLVHIPRRKR